MRRAWRLMLVALLPLACNRPGVAPVVATGPASPPGWEVRYNACTALVRRGSDHVLDGHVQETLREMLDEQQQLRNFKVTDEKGVVKKDKEGHGVPDVNAAQLTVVSTLHALIEFHRRRPEVDLAPFKPAIEKLAQSQSLVVSVEAKKAQGAMWK
jgi:hypothetical protein